MPQKTNSNNTINVNSKTVLTRILTLIISSYRSATRLIALILISYFAFRGINNIINNTFPDHVAAAYFVIIGLLTILFL